MPWQGMQNLLWISFCWVIFRFQRVRTHVKRQNFAYWLLLGVLLFASTSTLSAKLPLACPGNPFPLTPMKLDAVTGLRRLGFEVTPAITVFRQPTSNLPREFVHDKFHNFWPLPRPHAIDYRNSLQALAVSCMYSALFSGPEAIIRKPDS